MTDDRLDAAILVLPGITATEAKLAALRRFLEPRAQRPVLVPRLPYARGLRAAADWLRDHLAGQLRPDGGSRLDVLAYIGGGAVLRTMARGQMGFSIGRIVYDRGPVQEAASARLARIVPAPILCAVGLRGVVDLDRGAWRELPFPRAEGGAGLIVETEASRLARLLRIRPGDLPPESWDAERLLPGARAVLRLPLSHDEVYDDPLFLSEALRFLDTGRFGAEGADDA